MPSLSLSAFRALIKTSVLLNSRKTLLSSTILGLPDLRSKVVSLSILPLKYLPGATSVLDIISIFLSFPAFNTTNFAASPL